MKTFHTRWWLVPLCEKITNHKYNKLVFYTQRFVDDGFKYPNRNDFHYKCRICGYLFFNHKISPKNLEKIKKWWKDNPDVWGACVCLKLKFVIKIIIALMLFFIIFLVLNLKIAFYLWNCILMEFLNLNCKRNCQICLLLLKICILGFLKMLILWIRNIQFARKSLVN